MRKDKNDGTTSDLAVREPRSAAQSEPRVLALVLVWSEDEPHRVGEALFVPLHDETLRFWFGRGTSDLEGDAGRVTLERQRPGVRHACSPLTARWLSRKQLVFVPSADAVGVENVGRCVLRVNGAPVDRAVLRQGDTVALGQRLLFLVTSRLAVMPPLAAYPPERVPPFGEPDVDGIVGESPEVWALRDRIAFFAGRRQHVLLSGESGTGKELAARALHDLSARRGRPLTSRNAATFPATLIDAELFGNAKNYPNPGMPERAGLIGAADGSTLFLDEIGELPLDLQPHLLRVLDEGGEYQRLGDAGTRRADIRVIVATNRPVDQLKHDLLARLRLRLALPTLNERREDVPLLVRHALRRLAQSDPGIGSRFLHGEPGLSGEPRLSLALLEALLAHRYVHHVRELEALLWLAISSSVGGGLELTPEVQAGLRATPPETAGAAPAPKGSWTREAIQACLDRHEGKQEAVWGELGMRNRYVLKRLMKKYGLKAKT